MLAAKLSEKIAKFAKSSPYFWLHKVKSKVNISQNFVAFSENMNFNYKPNFIFPQKWLLLFT